MDWHHAQQAALQCAATVDQSSPVHDTSSTSTSAIALQHRAMPQLDAAASWSNAAQEGSSQHSHGWSAPSANYAHWQAGPQGSPRVEPSVVLNSNSTTPLSADPREVNAAAPVIPSAADLGHSPRDHAVERGDHRNGTISMAANHHQQQHHPPSFPSRDDSASTLSPGLSPLPDPDSALMVTVASNDNNKNETATVLDCNGDGAPPAVTSLIQAIAGGAPTLPVRPTPKKKSRGPRVPKKKPLKPANTTSTTPVRRRAHKVKKTRPAEVALGENGRERAMALLRLLVDSPLSDEFHKPVTQLHPEVGNVVPCG